MKRRDKNVEEFMLRHLGLFKTPPQSDMDLVETRIQNRLRTAPAADSAADELGSRGNSWKLRRLALVLGAAAVIAVVFLQMPRAIDTHAVVESPDGTLSRVSGERTESVRFGGRIDAGEVLRTNAGGAIALSDGSRVELRSGSEFSVERGDDGVRIHLRKGSLIVKAAKQVVGRLYVHTKDMVVSVVGTVFLVNAEEEGSHVSVIEGEVRVQHGETTQNLLAGQQFTTNPTIEIPPVKEELSWSREAEVHVAMLEQSAAAPPPQNPVEARVAFEVVSIRPGNPYQMPPAGARGVPPGDGTKPPAPSPPGDALARTMTCGGRGSELDVNPGRMTLQNGTVYRLIVLGYGLKDCILSLQMGLISGGAEWVRTERFDIVGTIPEGSPVYTRAQLNNGEAARLQLMIQTLLAERFNLVLERETRDLPAYNLVVARAGKIKASEDQTPPPPLARGTFIRTSAMPRGVMLNCTGNALRISDMASCLQKSLSAAIIDKTDLKGLYDIPLYSPDPALPGLSTDLILEPLGLKLERTKAPGEVLAIKRVERPTEN
jgi:uncharacterized protein (TIGR03435 family)